MKKFYSLPGILIAVAFLIASFILINKSHEESKLFKEEKNKVAEILNFNDRLLSMRDWIFTEKAWEEKKAEFDKTIAAAETHYTKAKDYGVYILWISLAFTVLVTLIYVRRRKFFGLTLSLTFVSMALLGQGVMNPILEMGAFKEDLTIKFYVKTSEIPYYQETVDYMEDVVEYMGVIDANIEIIRLVHEDSYEYIHGLMQEGQSYVKEGHQYLSENADTQVGIDKVFSGRTYFYYQNKGIMDVIMLLWNNNNKPVAAAIGTFSVIVPSIKLLFTLIILLFPVFKAKRLRKVLSYISKWSMADVFVVGAFLAYLSFANMSPGVQMDADVLFGLYYFGGYVILSIGLGYLLDAAIKEKIKISEQELPGTENTNDKNIDNEYSEE